MIHNTIMIQYRYCRCNVV